MMTPTSIPHYEVTSGPARARYSDNQWTFFNKKIEALKHQAADGSAPATLVKETTSGRNRGPKPKKASSDDEPAAPIMASQEYQPQQVLTGKFMPMNEVVQTVAALPSSMDANGEALPRRAPKPTPDEVEVYETMSLCEKWPVRGFTYMDMPQHPHPQSHEPIQMYPGPSHHQCVGPGPYFSLRRDSVLGCLCRCILVPHLQGIGPGPSQVQYPAPGHAAMSTSDDEEVYETPHLSVPAS
ncbi:hypothetical protein H9L39_00186 [Fusarium oxysporum f. sp. albedinis]|nr:hypothetical protein H9L39_00186 [Fusarium oxysporum f. sp. albedinis]